MSSGVVCTCVGDMLVGCVPHKARNPASVYVFSGASTGTDKWPNSLPINMGVSADDLVTNPHIPLRLLPASIIGVSCIPQELLYLAGHVKKPARMHNRKRPIGHPVCTGQSVLNGIRIQHKAAWTHPKVSLQEAVQDVRGGHIPPSGLVAIDVVDFILDTKLPRRDPSGFRLETFTMREMHLRTMAQLGLLVGDVAPDVDDEEAVDVPYDTTILWRLFGRLAPVQQIDTDDKQQVVNWVLSPDMIVDGCVYTLVGNELRHVNYYELYMLSRQHRATGQHDYVCRDTASDADVMRIAENVPDHQAIWIQIVSSAVSIPAVVDLIKRKPTCTFTFEFTCRSELYLPIMMYNQ